MNKISKKIPLRSIKAKGIFHKIYRYIKGPFWFLTGFILAGITIVSILAITFQNIYKDRVIPGVMVDDISLSEKKYDEIKDIFDQRNKIIENATFTFKYETDIATVSAKTLKIGYNSDLIATQSLLIGKSSNIFTNFYNILNAYVNGITLDSSFTYNEDLLQEILQPMAQKAYIEPVDALFQVENEKVTAFKESSNGRQLDTDSAENYLKKKVAELVKKGEIGNYAFTIPAIELPPDVTTEEVNSFGIVEKIGEGVSYFPHSIPNRIFNINLASQRVNGILVKPGEDFSFVKHLGDVSKATGYAQAYIIQGGRTILGDGGGVCQVSTTLFRAILNAGLPVVERRPHAYRVSYYEVESPAGFDAAVYYPTVDLKFHNDTGNYILVQSFIDLEDQSLRYVLYGKSDGRQVTISDATISNIVPAPEPLNQDDPTLAKGTVKQIDFAAAGATAKFKRIVKKNGEVIIDETYTSRYSPWRAVYLVGTKEG